MTRLTHAAGRSYRLAAAVPSSAMPDDEIEQRLRATGAVFIEAHEEAADAIGHARDAGMSPVAISELSGLSAETVAAFLRARD